MPDSLHVPVALQPGQSARGASPLALITGESGPDASFARSLASVMQGKPDPHALQDVSAPGGTTLPPRGQNLPPADPAQLAGSTVRWQSMQPADAGATDSPVGPVADHTDPAPGRVRGLAVLLHGGQAMDAPLASQAILADSQRSGARPLFPASGSGADSEIPPAMSLSRSAADGVEEMLAGKPATEETPGSQSILTDSQRPDSRTPHPASGSGTGSDTTAAMNPPGPVTDRIRGVAERLHDRQTTDASLASKAIMTDSQRSSGQITVPVNGPGVDADVAAAKQPGHATTLTDEPVSTGRTDHPMEALAGRQGWAPAEPPVSGQVITATGSSSATESQQAPGSTSTPTPVSTQTLTPATDVLANVTLQGQTASSGQSVTATPEQGSGINEPVPRSVAGETENLTIQTSRMGPGEAQPSSAGRENSSTATDPSVARNAAGLAGAESRQPRPDVQSLMESAAAPRPVPTTAAPQAALNPDAERPLEAARKPGVRGASGLSEAPAWQSGRSSEPLELASSMAGDRLQRFADQWASQMSDRGGRTAWHSAGAGTMAVASGPGGSAGTASGGESGGNPGSAAPQGAGSAAIPPSALSSSVPAMPSLTTMPGNAVDAAARGTVNVDAALAGSREAFSAAGSGPGSAREQWGEALSQRISLMTARNQSEARIQLDPPELGKLMVQIQVNNEQASVSFTSPHAMVREALEASVPRLQDMLAEQGLDLLDVDISEQSQQQDDGREDGQRGTEVAADDDQAPAGDTEIADVIGSGLSLVDDYA